MNGGCASGGRGALPSGKGKRSQILGREPDKGEGDRDRKGKEKERGNGPSEIVKKEIQEKGRGLLLKKKKKESSTHRQLERGQKRRYRKKRGYPSIKGKKRRGGKSY